jgi:murein DD-endopeptidase MepM/ murein hydrolase activator NlpD
MRQLQEPGTRAAVATILQQEHGDNLSTRSDVLESLVNRAVATGRHPKDLLMNGFYDPVNKNRAKYNALLNGTRQADKKDLDYLDRAADEVGRGRNQLGGRTDQGSRDKRGRWVLNNKDTMIIRDGEGYSFHERSHIGKTAASRTPRGPAPPPGVRVGPPRVTYTRGPLKDIVVPRDLNPSELPRPRDPIHEQPLPPIGDPSQDQPRVPGPMAPQPRIGDMPQPSGGGGGGASVISPFKGISDYGIRSGNVWGAARSGGARPHSGLDLHAPNGTATQSMTGGTVLYNGRNQGYNANIVIQGDDGIIRRYAVHGQTANLRPGQRVEQGQNIGTIAEGHLHYEEIHPTLPNGKPNPVYQQFQNNARTNTFTSTSYQRGVSNPTDAIRALQQGGGEAHYENGRLVPGPAPGPGFPVGKVTREGPLDPIDTQNYQADPFGQGWGKWPGAEPEADPFGRGWGRWKEPDPPTELSNASFDNTANIILYQQTHVNEQGLKAFLAGDEHSDNVEDRRDVPPSMRPAPSEGFNIFKSDPEMLERKENYDKRVQTADPGVVDGVDWTAAINKSAAWAKEHHEELVQKRVEAGQTKEEANAPYLIDQENAQFLTGKRDHSGRVSNKIPPGTEDPYAPTETDVDTSIFHTGPKGVEPIYNVPDPQTGKIYRDTTPPLDMPASGAHPNEPGIAWGRKEFPKMGRETLGGYYIVTPKAGPNAGIPYVVRHTDIGPGAPGRHIDVNAPLSRDMYRGYNPSGGMYIQYIGKDLPEGLPTGKIDPNSNIYQALKERYKLSDNHTNFIEQERKRREYPQEGTQIGKRLDPPKKEDPSWDRGAKPSDQQDGPNKIFQKDHDDNDTSPSPAQNLEVHTRSELVIKHENTGPKIHKLPDREEHKKTEKKDTDSGDTGGNDNGGSDRVNNDDSGGGGGNQMTLQ